MRRRVSMQASALVVFLRSFLFRSFSSICVPSVNVFKGSGRTRFVFTEFRNEYFQPTFRRFLSQSLCVRDYTGTDRPKRYSAEKTLPTKGIKMQM